MTKEIDWDKLRDERRAQIARFNNLPFDRACRELRTALQASPSLFADRDVNTVYEGPTRSSLLPLPYELLREFSERRDEQAADWLFEHASDPNTLVAAYCLFALADLEDSRLLQASAKVVNRSEHIHTVYGSFGWNGMLSEYAQRLLDDDDET